MYLVEEVCVDCGDIVVVVGSCEGVGANCESLSLPDIATLRETRNCPGAGFFGRQVDIEESRDYN